MSITIQSAAASLIAKGFAVQPIKPGQKRPTANGWSTRSATPDEFADGDSICILTGWPSDGGLPDHSLVCVDLDAMPAVNNADQYLPPTPMTDGRPGKPNSHRYYLVPNSSIPPEYTGPHGDDSDSALAAKERGVHPGPMKVRFVDAAKECVVEMLGSGQQTNCPPAVWTDKKDPTHTERRTWADDTLPAPAVIDFTVLLAAVQKLAGACGGRQQSLPKQPAERASYTPPTPTPVGRCELPGDDRVQRCRDYLDGIPTADLSRSGHGGQDECYRVARLIVHDFAVADRDAALSLLHRYNDRLRPLNDAWSEGELRHKLDAALSAPRDGGFGGKLAPLPPPMAWDNPKRLADEFLRGHTVRCLHDTPFLYDAGHYRPLGKKEFTGTVVRFIQHQAVAEHARRTTAWDAAEKGANRLTPKEYSDHQKRKPTVVPKVGRELVAATEQSIQAATQLPGTTQFNTWLANPRDASYLAVANGLLELRTRALIPHTPDYFTLTALPVPHDPAATCPRWDAYMRDVTEADDSKAAVLQEVAGACLDAHGPHKFFALLTGGGDNGKTVYLNVVGFVLGERNVSAVAMDKLSKRFGTFPLLDKLANIDADAQFHESKDEGVLRSLTGGDMVEFEQKGRDAIFGRNTAKLLFGCNTPPTFSDKTNAVWNRLAMVPFTWTVPADRKDPAMKTEPHWRAELPGVLNWMLEGLRRLHTNNRLTHSPACEAAKQQHRTDSNPAREFLLGHYEYTGSDKDRVSMPELYNSYTAWCSNDNIRMPLRKKTFNDEVKRLFPKIGDARPAKLNGRPERCWHGLRDVTAGETVPAGGLQSYGTVMEPAPVL